MDACRICWAPQHREYADASTMDGTRVWVPGQWEPCSECGWNEAPMEWDFVPLDRAPIYVGPAAPFPLQPTPEDILRGAGL